MDEITGRIAVHRIEKGSVVTRGMLESEEQITGEMEEAVIAGFRAEDLYQAVGGVLRAGDRIHIYCIDMEEFVRAAGFRPKRKCDRQWRYNDSCAEDQCLHGQR